MLLDGLQGLPLLLCLQLDLVLNIDTKAKREHVTATRPKLLWSIQNFFALSLSIRYETLVGICHLK
jgi:hypothetical protein